MFYSRPEPLSIELHGKLGLKRSDAPFSFAEAAQAVPLQVSEFGFAGKSYPIVFAGDQKSPMAVMSLRTNENLFVSRGRFEPDVYVPAFIRRYPFVLAENGPQEQMIVCIDRAADALVEDGDVPLFENGNLSAFAQQMVDFCSNFETDRLRTESFVGRLKALDLLEPTQAVFTPRMADGSTGRPALLADYFAVSEDKLRALPTETIVELVHNGALRQIYAHLESLQNWERLVARSQVQAPVAGHA